MHFQVLGPLRVHDDGTDVGIGGRLQRAVLALLLANRSEPSSVDAICSELWPDQPTTDVRDSLYVYVSQLRKARGRERIVRTAAGYRCTPLPGDEIDAVSFERSVAEGRRLIGSDPAQAAARIDAALALWRGRAYEGLEDVPSLAAEATRLDEMRVDAFEDLVDAQLISGLTPDLGGVAQPDLDHAVHAALAAAGGGRLAQRGGFAPGAADRPARVHQAAHHAGAGRARL